MDVEQQFRYLVVIETQKIKQYLFTSPYMRETRGGSVLLDRLNRKETEKLPSNWPDPEYRKIYLGGGSGRVLFRAKEKAEEFKEALLRLYKQETVSARIAIEVVERRPKESFPDWVSRGVHQTQHQKLAQSQAAPILAGRWIKPCTSCGREAAERMFTEFGEHRLCRACWLKRKEVDNLYVDIKPGKAHDRTLKCASQLASHYTAEFIFTTLAEYNEKKGLRTILPQDFDDIGMRSRPLNYMGFIYADGNGMGEIVKKIGREFPADEEAIKAYQAFSEIIDRATREAAVEAVLEAVDTDKHQDCIKIPAEFIIAGGDDLMLAVPAHNALDATVLFIEKFQEKTQQLQSQYIEKNKLQKPLADKGLTTSAGIVLAHVHYPASDLMILSGDLMKLAKQKAAALKEQEKQGTLDFMVLNEAASEPAQERRQREYLGKFNQQCNLTERPCTVAEARHLLQTIRALKSSGMPRTKLKAIYPVLFQSQWQALFEGQRIKERLKVTGALESVPMLQQLVADLDHFPFRHQDQPWHADGSKWSTPLTEIIELYDFVHIRQSVPEGAHE
jgi:hypothetical protein